MKHANKFKAAGFALGGFVLWYALTKASAKILEFSIEKASTVAFK